MRLSPNQFSTASRHSTLVSNYNTLLSRLLLLFSLLSLCTTVLAADAHAEQDYTFRHRRTFAHSIQARSYPLQARNAQDLDSVDSTFFKRAPQRGGNNDDDDNDRDRWSSFLNGFGISGVDFGLRGITIGRTFVSYGDLMGLGVFAWNSDTWRRFVDFVRGGGNPNSFRPFDPIPTQPAPAPAPAPPPAPAPAPAPSPTTTTTRITPPQNPAPAPSSSPNQQSSPVQTSNSPPSTPEQSRSSNSSNVPSTLSSLDTTSNSTSSTAHVTQTSEPTPTDIATGSDEKSNNGLIIGLVIGILLLLGICCALGFIFAKKRRERQQREKDQISSYSSQTWLAKAIGKGSPRNTFSKVEEAGSPITPSPVVDLVRDATPHPVETRENQHLSPMPIATTRPQTPSSYVESEFSEDNKSFSFRHYEPDPRIGVPVDYPLALHVPPRVAKALAKQDVVRQTNPVRPVSAMTTSTVPDPNHPLAKKRSSYFAVPPSTRTSYMSYTPGTDSSNGASMGHIPPVPTPPTTGDITRMDPVAAAMMRYSVASHESGTSDLPSPTLPPAVYRPADNSRRGISGVLSGNGNFAPISRKRVSAPLPPIPQDALPQDEDPFSSKDGNPTPSPPQTPGLRNPFARPLSQGSIITDETTATVERPEEVGGVVVASRVMASPASRVVYSVASTADRSSSSGASTILAYNNNTRNSGGNPFDDNQRIPEEQTMVVEVAAGDSWRSGPRVNLAGTGNGSLATGQDVGEEAYAGIVNLSIESSVAGTHEESTLPENSNRKSMILAFPAPPSPTGSR